MLIPSLKVGKFQRFPSYDSEKVVREILMNKNRSFHIWHVLLANIAVFMFAGCRVLAPTVTSAPQSLTAVPPYIHYTLSDASNIHLEFDYPSSWGVSERIEAGITIVSLWDPRFLTLPTPSDIHGTPSDFGSVDIYVKSATPGQTLDTLIESHKQGYSNINWVTALNNYKIAIDGYDAIVFEDRIDFPEFYTSLIFERNIFFVAKDQTYQIVFSVAEKDRGSEFEQGYEYFFNSLKIMP